MCQRGASLLCEPMTESCRHHLKRSQKWLGDILFRGPFSNAEDCNASLREIRRDTLSCATIAERTAGTQLAKPVMGGGHALMQNPK
ncbi:unnamed protein product [Lampetra planeri]